MTTHAHRVMTSSVDPNWRTPEALLLVLFDEFDFVLDAAASAMDVHQMFRAFIGPGSEFDEDGLAADWVQHAGGRPVFCNPPFSLELYRKTGNPAYLIDNWVKKMATTAIDQEITVVGVIPHTPQTKRWRTYVEGILDPIQWAAGAPVYRATEVRLFESRVKFEPSVDHVGTASGANANTAVVVWRPYKQGQFAEPWAPLVRYMRY